jgi:hypothetical protein
MYGSIYIRYLYERRGGWSEFGDWTKREKKERILYEDSMSMLLQSGPDPGTGAVLPDPMSPPCIWADDWWLDEDWDEVVLEGERKQSGAGPELDRPKMAAEWGWGWWCGLRWWFGM